MTEEALAGACQRSTGQADFRDTASHEETYHGGS